MEMISWLTPWHIVLLVLLFVLFIFVINVLSGFFFTIHTKSAGIVERLGKFEAIAGEGLNFKIPFIDKLVYTEDLAMQLMDVPVESKTKDDATITVPIRVQYFVLPAKIKEAYYELDDPEDQIKAHVENVILSYIPKLTLDESYMQEDQIAQRVKDSLSEVMAKFGYCIENALVRQILPAQAVVDAMNNINAARREKVATEAKAEGIKISMIAKAEAESEARILQGRGVAGERAAIVKGLKDSVADFEHGVTGVSAHEVMAMVMLAQYFDALKDIGAKSNTILMPHSPSFVMDLMGQLTQAVSVGALAAQEAGKST